MTASPDRPASGPEATDPAGAGPQVPAASSQTPPTHQRLVFGEVIAEDGKVRTYLAEDLVLKRQVAVMVVPAQGGQDADAALRGTRIAARLDHPHATAIHAWEVDAHGATLVELRPPSGTTLADIIRSSRQVREPAIATPNAVTALMLQVCHAVGHAHAMGVVHRSIRPHHILVGTRGEVSLAGQWHLT